jgi:hypothetical protein
MSTREALVERVKKANDASRQRLHAYIGANDYLYDQVRRSPGSLQGLQDKLGKVEFKLANPSKLRESVQDRIAAARNRRDELANRGESIAADWHEFAAVKDVTGLIKTVRQASGASDIAKSVRTWLAQYPAASTAKANSKSPIRSASKTLPRKPATTKPANA